MEAGFRYFCLTIFTMVNGFKKGFLIFLITALAGLDACAQFYQGYQMPFGKSRVQYDKFFWTFYRQKRFDVYFNVGGQSHADFVTAKAADVLGEIEKTLDYRFGGRISFILFNSLSDLRQSNIGRPPEEQYNTGGTTKIVGNKIFLCFNGSRENLLEQVRGGITQILVNQVLYGGDIKDVIQNAALLSLPEWFMSGLVSYISKPWDTDIDNRVRDGIVSGNYKKFNRLSGDDALYAGHSVWAYLVETYGIQSISNLLYMTRVNRSVESGFLFVIGMGSRAMNKAWYAHYESRFSRDIESRQSLPEAFKRSKKGTEILSSSSISPDGKKLAVVSNTLGKFKLKIHDLETGRKKVLLRKGYKNLDHKQDLSNPVFCWNHDGSMISYFWKKGKHTKLFHYHPLEKKTDKTYILNFETIFEAGYSPDGQSLLMSAVKDGKRDIFVYNLRTRVPEQITNDHFDDFSPVFFNKGSAILFASDRPGDTLGLSQSDSLGGSGKTDIFLYDYKTKSKVLRRIVTDPGSRDLFPVPVGENLVSYLSDQNGISNIYLATLDSVLSFIDTSEHYRQTVSVEPVSDFPLGILSQDKGSKSGKQSGIFYSDGRYQLYLSDLPKPGSSMQSAPSVTSFIQNQMGAVKQSIPKPPVVNPSGPAIINIESPVKDTTKREMQEHPPAFFQDEFSYRKDHSKVKSGEAGEVENNNNEKPQDSVFSEAPKAPGILKRNYLPSFRPGFLQFQVDNSLMSPTYQIFTGTGPIAFGQGINLLGRISTTDIFEDYRITGAVKVSGDFKNLGYFLSAENDKKRLDKQLSYFREARTYSFFSDLIIYRVHTNEVKYALRYPFSEIFYLKGIIGLRADRYARLATDLVALNEPFYYEYYSYAKLEWVFDNTIPRGLNLYNGVRFKIFCEYMQRQDISFGGKFNSPQKLTPGPVMFIPGFDFRWYQRIHRDLIWANRLAGGSSLGKSKMVYYLGGTDNWFGPRFNNEIPVDFNRGYMFQALATNLRGFEQNIRNGSNFLLVNSEVRFPVFKYFFSRPIKSDFVKNFQLVGFGDVGSAWSGIHPFDSTNALNSQVIEYPPITITLVNQRYPIVGGYGLGIRSRFLGYFFRIDYAWGVENGKSQPRIIYFSLSLDF